MHPQILHGSAVAFGDRAVLILGPSGSGKSTLAMRLIGLGGVLVGDDRVEVHATDGQVRVTAAPNLSGLIEARGVGILRAPEATGPVPVTLVVDLGQAEPDRLPPRRTIDVAGVVLPCLHNSASPAFPEAVRLHLLKGRHA